MSKVYGYVTERFIEALENDVVPWQRPWVGNGLPKNLSSGKPYRGVNVMVLNTIAIVEGYKTNWWLTRKQCIERGGTIKQGERYSPVVFWTWVKKEDDNGEDASYAYLRYYRVFNVDQCEGITAPEMSLPNGASLHEHAEKFIADMPEEMPRPIVKGGSAPSYSPSTDEIRIPDIERFDKTAEFYGAVFHEIIHATGHPDRLHRFDNDGNSSDAKAYAKEELVAQIGAAFICAMTGIEPEYDNDAAYIQHWLSILKEKENERLIVHASACAQKAVDYLVSATFDNDDDNDSED